MARKPSPASARSKGPARRVQTILVTGAGGLLGQAFTNHLLATGRRVVAVYRTRPASPPPLATSDNFLSVNLDLMKKNAVGRLVDYLAKQGWSVDGLVHGARSRSNLAIDKIPSRQQWSDEFELAVGMIHELVTRLAEQPGARLKKVVLVGSMYGIVAVSPHLYPKGMARPPLHYGVAKAALVHLTKELAVVLAPKGINVNAVSIGGIEGRVNSAFKRRYRTLCPQGRMLSVAEAIGPIDFLLGDAADGIVGSNLVVDGGWSVW